MTNPLIDQGSLLNWPAIKTEHITPALDELLAKANEAVAKVTAPETPATWSDVVDPLEQALEKLSRAWSAVGHLSGVMDSEALREAYNANLPRMTQFYIELSQNEALFAKYKAIDSSEGFAALSEGCQRIIKREIRDFRLSGAELAPEPKARLKALGQQDAADSQKFSENLLDATNAFALDIEDVSELDGIPSDVVDMYAASAKAAGLEGKWRISLHMPSYLPAMQYANNAALREKLHRAYSTRASEFGPAERDNTPLIRSLLKNRHEEALLLGFKNYAEVSLVPKMADSPAAVEAFLTELAQKARAKGEADWEEVKTFAKEKLGLNEVHPWDAAWVSESLRRAKYAYSDHEVKRYFTLPAVFSGMFRLVEKLFDVRISGSGLARRRQAVADFRRFRQSHRAFLHRPLRSYQQTRRRLDGQRHHLLRATRRDSENAGCLPRMQLLAARRRQAGASHARRRHDALSRIRPRSASHALARTAGATFRH